MHRTRVLRRLAIAGSLAAAVTGSVAVTPATGQTRAAGLTQKDLVTSTAATTYRIPDIAVTTRGTVLLAYDRRNGQSSDLPGDIDTLMLRSTDNGATWSAPADVVDYPGPQGCGDSSMIVDRSNGRIFLFCTYSAGTVGFGNSQAGTNDTTDPNTLHVQVRHSDDDGLTWSAPTDLNPSTKDVTWRAVFASSGHGIQTSTGRLIQPIVVKDGDGAVHSGNIYSDDHGNTWKRGELLAAGTDESKAVERADGTIVQNSRPSSGGYRLISTSTDGGRTFGAPARAPQLIDPRVNGDQIRVNPATSGARRSWMLFANPASQLARENMTIRLSCDGGQTWPIARLIHAGPAAYPAMAMLRNGRIGIFYERGASSSIEKMTFATLQPEDLGAQCDD